MEPTMQPTAEQKQVMENAVHLIQQVSTDLIQAVLNDVVKPVFDSMKTAIEELQTEQGSINAYLAELEQSCDKHLYLDCFSTGVISKEEARRLIGLDKLLAPASLSVLPTVKQDSKFDELYDKGDKNA